MAWMDQMDHHSVNLILTIDRIWKKCEKLLLQVPGTPCDLQPG